MVEPLIFSRRHDMWLRIAAGIPDNICRRDRNSRNQVPQYRWVTGEETRQLTRRWRRPQSLLARLANGRTFHRLLYQQTIPRDDRSTGKRIWVSRAWAVINCRGKNGSALAFFEFRPNFRANGDKRRWNLWPPTRKVRRGIRDWWSAGKYDE